MHTSIPEVNHLETIFQFSLISSASTLTPAKLFFHQSSLRLLITPLKKPQRNLQELEYRHNKDMLKLLHLTAIVTKLHVNSA